jgi:hypothetical protein
MTTAIPTQRRTPATCSCGAPFNAAGFCTSTDFCLATDLDFEVALDRMSEACDDQ